MSAQAEAYYIGVDVGTDSVRAGLFTTKGKLIAHSKHPIQLWINYEILEGSYEQSSEDIWSAVKHSVKDVIKGIDSCDVKGIGFDATCSLVVVDSNGCPVTVSPTHEFHRNVILWQDHRAIQEANEINALAHPVLRYVGGVISPEMEPPKLLWLRRHLYDECWRKASYFFDLVDYLTYKSTDAPVRSLCSLVCKWCYVPPSVGDNKFTEGWDDSFWAQIGLEDLTVDGYIKLGENVQYPGSSISSGLSSKSASELGLVEGTPVASGLIDAHAGALGMLGADTSHISLLQNSSHLSRLALISGTSSCHMKLSDEPLFINGVWGPYSSVILPNMHLNEGGQSAAGSLVHHITHTFPLAVADIKQGNSALNDNFLYGQLESVVYSLSNQRGLPFTAYLTESFHMLPDYHGNRSPLSDPTLHGMVCGLTLGDTKQNLAITYLATLQALAYNTRYIIESMTEKGHVFDSIFICGGFANNKLYMQCHADITGLPVVLTDEKECVLLGSAMLAAAASTGHQLTAIMKEMATVNSSNVVYPKDLLDLIK